MAKITLLLDEDVRPILGEILRQRGYDAVHVLDAGRTSLTAAINYNHYGLLILGPSKTRDPRDVFNAFSWRRGDEDPGGIWFFQPPACLIQGMQRVKIFFLVHVEGSFYGLIQFLGLTGIARAH